MTERSPFDPEASSLTEEEYCELVAGGERAKALRAEYARICAEANSESPQERREQKGAATRLTGSHLAWCVIALCFSLLIWKTIRDEPKRVVERAVQTARTDAQNNEAASEDLRVAEKDLILAEEGLGLSPSVRHEFRLG
jgi:hypothetical protein